MTDIVIRNEEERNKFEKSFNLFHENESMLFI